MNKNYFLCVMVVHAFFMQSTPSCPWTPDTAVFAFDLHDVVVKPDWVLRVRNFCALSWREKVWLFLAVARPSFLADLFFVSRNNVPAECMMAEMQRLHPILNTYENLFWQLINAYIPNDEMIIFLRGLQKNGFSLYLASNIGPRAFEMFAQTHPAIVDFFEVCIYPDERNGHARKPSLDYFDYLMDEIARKEGDKEIIFVDDRLENVRAARAHGLHGFLYVR